MTGRRDIALLLGLFGLLIAAAVASALRPQTASIDRVPTTHSSGGGGALALLRWTQELGYDSRRLEYREFALTADDHALVVLGPSELINRTDTQATMDWVAAGGLLIVADDQGIPFGGNGLVQALKAKLLVYTGTAEIERAPVLQPAMGEPPVQDALVHADHVLSFSRDDYAPLIGLPDGLVLAGISVGQGYVYLSSSVVPFTNDGLRDEQNGAILLTMLRRVPSGGRVLFDEIHHGYVSPPSLRAQVLGNAWGWGLLAAIVTLAAFVILTGRRFGRPVPLREETARRTSAEYVESMADLFQRGGQRAFVLRHYRDSFKRRLARPYGISPQLDDAVFVEELARLRVVDAPALLAQLRAMRRDRLSEAELLAIVAASAKF